MSKVQTLILDWMYLTMNSLEDREDTEVPNGQTSALEGKRDTLIKLLTTTNEQLESRTFEKHD